jgi:hypothetical protein
MSRTPRRNAVRGVAVGTHWARIGSLQSRGNERRALAASMARAGAWSFASWIRRANRIAPPVGPGRYRRHGLTAGAWNGSGGPPLRGRGRHGLSATRHARHRPRSRRFGPRRGAPLGQSRNSAAARYRSEIEHAFPAACKIRWEICEPAPVLDVEQRNGPNRVGPISWIRKSWIRMFDMSTITQGCRIQATAIALALDTSSTQEPYGILACPVPEGTRAREPLGSFLMDRYERLRSARYGGVANPIGGRWW